MPATGAVNFKLNVAVWNASLFPEVRERLKDLQPFFEEVISDWTRGNVDKFRMGEGAQESGVSFSPEPSWDPLTPRYAKDKARKGFRNWLMVRTGTLMSALTSEGAFFRFTDAARAVFGTPNNPDEADKVKWNWSRRQTVFLDANDMKTVALFWHDFMTLGPKFRQIKNSAALEQERWNADFAFQVESGE